MAQSCRKPSRQTDGEACFVNSDILGRHDRTQIRADFDPVIGRAHAALTIERGGECFRIRRLDGAQLREKAPLILARSNAVEPLSGGFALRDFLARATHQLQ